MILTQDQNLMELWETNVFLSNNRKMNSKHSTIQITMKTRRKLSFISDSNTIRRRTLNQSILWMVKSLKSSNQHGLWAIRQRASRGLSRSRSLSLQCPMRRIMTCLLFVRKNRLSWIRREIKRVILIIFVRIL